MQKLIIPDEPEIPILPNLFTAGNLLCGFFAIMTILQGMVAGSTTQESGYQFQAAYSLYQQATYFIFASCLFDLLDGRIARMSGQEGPFGREFDSLADIVSFGIAPALLLSKAVLFSIPYPGIAWGIAALYLLCAGLRLARFNCMAMMPRKTGQTTNFVGLPVPMAAGTIVSTMYLIIHLYRTEIDLGLWKYVLAAAMVGISILMMSRVIYPSFKHINFTTKGTVSGIIVASFAVVALFYFPWVMPAVMFCVYLLYGLVRPWIARRWQAILEARSFQHDNDKNEAD